MSAIGRHQRAVEGLDLAIYALRTSEVCQEVDQGHSRPGRCQVRDSTITVTQQDGFHHHSTTRRRREEDSVEEGAVLGPLLEREGEEVLEENVTHYVLCSPM